MGSGCSPLTTSCPPLLQSLYNVAWFLYITYFFNEYYFQALYGILFVLQILKIYLCFDVWQPMFYQAAEATDRKM